MNKRNKTQKASAEELDRMFDSGTDDMLPYLDLDSSMQPNLEQRRVNVDFPVWMIKALDDEACRAGVPRQSLIKVWLSRQLDEVNDARLSAAERRKALKD